MKVELDPSIVVWEYTLKCNSLCLHCGSDAKFPRENELTTAESLDLVKQISDIGFKRVVLSGGEPTLRDDWVVTAEKIQSEKMECGIISNALAWDSKTIDSLVGLRPFSIGFSVDGEKNLHDFWRGVPGSHEKIFSYINELKGKGLTICAITSVNKENLKELKQIGNRLVSYGVDAWQLQVASPMGRMANSLKFVLNDSEYYQFAQFVSEARERFYFMNIQAADCVGYFGKFEGKIRDAEWSGCGAGICGIGIESDGTIRGCLSLRDPRVIEGNIRESSLKSIWSNAEKFKYNRQFDFSKLAGECKGCVYGEKCGGGCQSQCTAFSREFHDSPFCLFRYEKRK